MSNTTSGPVYRILQVLKGVEARGDQWMARCPAHADGTASLSVGSGDQGQALVKCFAGCSAEAIVAALGLTLADLFEQPERPRSGRSSSKRDDGDQPRDGLTVAEYGEAKGLPLDFLRGVGLKDVPYLGAGAVRIPYRDATGQDSVIRYRLAMSGDGRFAWKSGSKVQPYGLWRLADARAAGTIVLCEGETDAQTLWLHDIPALGVPGADAWKEEWAAYLDGIATIIVVIEPDAGGEAVMRWLERSAIRSRAHVLQMSPNAKDPSALYLADRDGFRAAWDAAVAGAVPWSVIEGAAREERRRAEWEVCAPLARESRILDRFAGDLEQFGLVGETRTAKIVYLAVTSRRFDRPVSLAAKGPSSAGKSYTVEQTLKFFPDSAYHALTAMSERALAYSTEPLDHRILVLYEAAGMAGDFASYLIRSLLSEGRLRYETVEKTKDGIQARVIEREGPTGLIVTTTAIHLHPENETRLLTLPVTDTPEQTRNVLLSLADEDRADPDLRQWHALQSWIEAGPCAVTVPFAARLADLIPPVAVRLRRDFRAVLTLIRSHALLHQASRERDGAGRIVATLGDYAVVRDLIADLVADGVEASVPATVRETVTAITLLLQEGDRAHVAVADVARELKVDKSVALRRVQAAEFRGFVRNLEDKRGRPARLVLADALPGDVEILPTVAGLQGCTRERRDTQPPPPGDEFGGDDADDPDGGVEDISTNGAATLQPSCAACGNPTSPSRPVCLMCQAEGVTA